MRAPVVSSAAPANPVVPGALLAGKYRVARILGQGGMGYVVEARHVTLDERVALKFLLPEYAKHPEASERFLREARAAVKIKSEHVARVSDVGTLDTGAPYMVMEFLDGRDLADTLEKTGVLSVEDAIDYIVQACEAIAEAHSYGIVHRDLKPANMFLAKRPDGSPLVKVLDFGISKVMGGENHALTRTSTAMGSALYMSPEQMQETRGVDHRTDIYAMGIALFELLAGRPPFYAETLPQLCAEVLTGTPKPMSAFRPDIPQDLAARLERAYERDKNRRYQSIAEFAVALAPYAPARSQGTIDRIARMGGIQPPQRNESTTSTPGIRAPSAPIIITSANNASSDAMARTAATDELPAVIAGTTPHVSVSDMAPPPSEMRIEPGSYRAPISTNAAAAFAHASKPGTPATSRSFLLGALLLGGVVAASAIVAVSYLRQQAQVGAEDVPVVAATSPNSTPPVVAPLPSSVATAAATETAAASADKPPETAPPPPSTSAAPLPGTTFKPAGAAKTAPSTKPTATTKTKSPDDFFGER